MEAKFITCLNYLYVFWVVPTAQNSSLPASMCPQEEKIHFSSQPTSSFASLCWLPVPPRRKVMFEVLAAPETNEWQVPPAIQNLTSPAYLTQISFLQLHLLTQCSGSSVSTGKNWSFVAELGLCARSARKNVCSTRVSQIVQGELCWDKPRGGADR